MDTSRREILAAMAAGSSSALGACLDLPGGAGTPVPEEDWYVRPESEADPVAPLECGQEEFARESRWVEADPAWGDVYEGDDLVFTLRVSGRSFEFGETVHIIFRNVSTQERSTGNPHKVNLDIWTEDGWVDVRGWPDGQAKPITDDSYPLEPGETHKWEFPLTAEGVVQMSFPSHHDEITVCPEFQPGRYRFGFGNTMIEDVAVAFDVTDAA